MGETQPIPTDDRGRPIIKAYSLVRLALLAFCGLMLFLLLMQCVRQSWGWAIADAVILMLSVWAVVETVVEELTEQR